MDERQPATRCHVIEAGPITKPPTPGFRHYWYPVLESRLLKKRPKAVKVLGEKIVLMRDGDKVRALHDRCPHRGVPFRRAGRSFREHSPASITAGPTSSPPGSWPRR